MAVDLKALEHHPGVNPEYFEGMKRRRSAQVYNRQAGSLMSIPVPKQPNKYVPHIGAKQRNRSTDKTVSPNINQE